MKQRPQKAASTGLSLVELMVALAVGAIITAGVIQVFISTKQNYRLQENVARMQENARFALEYLRRDIRMAGSWGCLQNPEIVIAPDNGPQFTPPPLQRNQVLNNLDEPEAGDEWSYGDPISGTDGINQTSDSLSLWLAQDTSIRTTPTSDSNSAQLSTTSSEGIATGDIIMVTDCNTGAIYQVTPGGPGMLNQSTGGAVQPGNKSQTFDANFSEGALVLKVFAIRYLVCLKDGIPVLYREPLNATSNQSTSSECPDDKYALVPGVESLQFTYGFDSDGDTVPDHFAPATTDADFSNVVAVQATLIMRSDDDNLTRQTAEGDRRLRQTFSSLIALRNRLN